MSEEFQFQPPVKVPVGMRIYTNTNGMTVMELHHTADPEKDWAWARRIRALTPQDQLRDWDREMNLADTVHEGRPFFPLYSPALHAAEHEFQFVPGSEYFIGCDFGLQPAVVFAQKTPAGQIQFFQELCFQNATAVLVAPVVRSMMDKLPVPRWEGVGDPSGQARSQVDGRSAFEVFAEHGIHLRPGVNDLGTRRDAVNWALTNHLMDSPLVPRLWIDREKCPTLHEGMSGGYKVRVTTVGQEEVMAEEPLKNWYSHVNEAAQYVIVEEYLRTAAWSYPEHAAVQRLVKRPGRLNY